MLAMLAHRTQSLTLVAAHDRGIADDVTEHDRRQLTRGICRQRIRGTRHRGLPFDSIGLETGSLRILLRRPPERETRSGTVSDAPEHSSRQVGTVGSFARGFHGTVWRCDFPWES